MSSEIAISVDGLSKCYQIYSQPQDRLKQSVYPRLQRLSGTPERQYFREFWALRDVSFSIAKGETVGIIGRNGSGKSTLLQIICGTLNQSAGGVQTNGRIAALLELGSGFNPEFSGRENVYLNGAVLGLTKEQIDAKFDKIADFAEIGEFIEQPVKTYSSGMLVRLAFAVAINVEPEILIIDEALSVGDERFQRKCFSRIEAIRKSGATILFVSHSGSTIVELCDRAILLDAGERLATGLPKQILGHYQKLLYAPEERRQHVRETVRAHHENTSVDKSGNRLALDVNNQTNEISAPTPETYDPNLKPSSTIAYESRGATITAPGIFTLSGERVNNLRRNGVYYYRYQVHFERSACNVRFGMLIKTTSGIELGGAASAASSGTSIAFVEAGAVFDIEFEFHCHLNQGVYFLNAGVLGDVSNSESYLHRLIDISMFRVMPESNEHMTTGMIDFSCRPNIQMKQP